VSRATVGRRRSRSSASCRDVSCWEPAARRRLFPDPDAPSMTACARSISTASCAGFADPRVRALVFRPRSRRSPGRPRPAGTQGTRIETDHRRDLTRSTMAHACLIEELDVDEAQSQPRFGARGRTSASGYEMPGPANRLRSPRASTLGKVPRRPPGSSSRPAAPPAGVPRGVSGRARGLLQPRTGNEQKSRNARLPLILFFDSGPTFQKGAHGAVPNRGLPSVSPDRW
jgi:hypothetical protein